MQNHNAIQLISKMSKMKNTKNIKFDSVKKTRALMQCLGRETLNCCKYFEKFFGSHLPKADKSTVHPAVLLLGFTQQNCMSIVTCRYMLC